MVAAELRSFKALIHSSIVCMCFIVQVLYYLSIHISYSLCSSVLCISSSSLHPYLLHLVYFLVSKIL